MTREGVLQPLELGPLRQPFDRQHLTARGVGREEAAGRDRPSVHQHRADPARLYVAGALRACQPQSIAKEVKQQLLRLHLRRHGAAVDLELESHAGGIPSSAPARRARRTQAAQYSSRKRSWYLSANIRSASSFEIGSQLTERRGDRLQADRAFEGDRAQDCPAHVLVGDDDAVVREDDGSARAERFRHGTPLLVLRDQLGGLVEDGDAVGEEDRVMREQLETRARRSECGRVRGMAVDDRSHVGPPRVDLGMQDRLQVQIRRRVVEVDDVVRLDLVQSHALALDVDGLAAGGPRADMAQRQVCISLQGEDPARPGDLLPHRVRPGRIRHRRCVGG